MMANQWQQVKEVFHAALEREPKERPQFIAEACSGDESLRSQVESLIVAHEKEGSFIDSPAYELAAGWLGGGAAESLAGQQINQYRIVESLGAGGMGEVYLAYDTKMGRKVALKLLPASSENDRHAYQLHRFHQEARAVSSLNHPNIITVHDIGEQNGRHFIVTELIEGQTLRRHLLDRRIDLGEALDIITQVASALAATHEVGIIHRDIKPDNIMLRRDGYVKVLDFGLAKLSERKIAPVEPEAPTLMTGNTSPGMVVGTVNYMSPEQARGLEVDERTDIWSLGVVLYEMLAGSEPFKGATLTDRLVSILEREPASLVSVSAEIPAELDWVVKKALRKESAERYQTVREMLGDLREIKQELEFEAKLGRAAAADKGSGALQAPSKPPAEPLAGATTASPLSISTNEIREAPPTGLETRKGRDRRSRLPLIAALSALGLALIGFAFYAFFLQSKKAVPFQAMNITRLTNHGKATSVAISPDGKYFVYVLSDAGRQSLWLRQVNAANDTEIIPPAPGGYFGVTFSRDGNNLYYVHKLRDAGALYKIPVLGGTPVKILENIDGHVGFSPDGKRLTFVRGDYPNPGESGLFIADADGSNQRQIAARKFPEAFAPIFFTGPSWSPDGRLIASAVSNTKFEGVVIAVNVEDGSEQVLTPQPWFNLGRVEWLPDMTGLLINAREQSSTVPQIWHLSYPGGEARKVTNDLDSYRAISLTADGKHLATVQLSGLINVWVAPGSDASGAVQLPTGNIGYSGGNEGLSWSSNGIVYVSGAAKRGDIWIMNPDGSNRRQLTSEAGSNHSPVVTPDGRHIVFTSTRSGQRNVWRMNLDGSDPQRLTSSAMDFFPVVSPDGQWIIYSTLSSGRPTLWKVPVGGGNAVEIINRHAINPAVSPDGKQIAYLFTEAPDPTYPPNRIGVIAFEGGEALKTFEVQPGLGGARTILHWSRDGRSLLYTAITNNVSNIWSQPLDGGKPRQLTDFKEHIITAFDWSPDGRQLAVARGVIIRDAVLISSSD
jgi:serine/threonine protein kinase/Tol biopolymer transport system component